MRVTPANHMPAGKIMGEMQLGGMYPPAPKVTGGILPARPPNELG